MSCVSEELRRRLYGRSLGGHDDQVLTDPDTHVPLRISCVGQRSGQCFRAVTLFTIEGDCIRSFGWILTVHLVKEAYESSFQLFASNYPSFTACCSDERPLQPCLLCPRKAISASVPFVKANLAEPRSQIGVKSNWDVMADDLRKYLHHWKDSDLRRKGCGAL